MVVSQQQATADNTQQQIPVPESLVEVTRGAITESRHRGHIVAVEPDGEHLSFLRFA